MEKIIVLFAISKDGGQTQMKMKKLLSAVLVFAMIFALTGCGSKGTSSSNGSAAGEKKSDIIVGAVLIGDDNEGYTYAHIKGIREAAKELGLTDDQIKWKYTIPEDNSCYDACVDLVGQGCSIIFSNSYGHQTYTQQAAKDYPDVTFVAMTGDTAANSGLSNFKNAFTSIYQARYVSGVVAGMKIAELVKDNKLEDKNFDKDGNVKMGYVGAYPYAEVVSGYTAFYLGAKSVYDKVSMEVQYTNSWFDITGEGTAAEALIADGCVIIGQHADSTGAPSACEAAFKKGTTVYSVGYNIDMLSVAPDAALTSATNNWEVYYKYAIGAAMNGDDVVTDWCKGFEEDAVAITELGTAAAEGTADKVAEVEKAIKDGTLKVFDTSKFTVGGKTVTECVVDLTGNFKTTDEGDKNAIWDGYFHESELRAAPSFSLRIDGITELN